MNYAAGYNMVGCLPDDPESVFITDSFESAREYVRAEIIRTADMLADGDAPPDRISPYLDAYDEAARWEEGENGVIVGFDSYWIQLTEEEVEDGD